MPWANCRAVTHAFPIFTAVMIGRCALRSDTPKSARSM